MKEMFSFSNFNNKIENWDVSNIRDMSSMFSLNHVFSNHDLTEWDVSNVTNHESFSNGWGTGNTEPNWNQ